jgi:hypothetical protein
LAVGLMQKSEVAKILGRRSERWYNNNKKGQSWVRDGTEHTLILSIIIFMKTTEWLLRNHLPPHQTSSHGLSQIHHPYFPSIFAVSFPLLTISIYYCGEQGDSISHLNGRMPSRESWNRFASQNF